ncbi:glucose-1-phosphate adenylyltransferase [Chloroflexota bacterium]
MKKTLAFILAGGQGERLTVLTQERAKPAIPFAGKYRIIDFTLSNCVNSGIYNVAVLTQYQPHSLIEHFGAGASANLDGPDRVLKVLQAYLTRESPDWYKGTGDAIYQNLRYIEEQDIDMVLVLSGDHIYTMDYSAMIESHEARQADVTLAVTQVPEEDLARFGTVAVDEAWRVTEFKEKMRNPNSNQVSMGVYLFNKDLLLHSLEEDAGRRGSKHDFGANIIPSMVGKSNVYAYHFDGYWQDIGTVQAYWKAHMDLIEMSPSPLFNVDWPVRTKEEERPPAIISDKANVLDSIISNGCVIEGSVEHSVISPGVMVAEGAVIKDSIIMSDSTIGQHSVVDCAIVDKEVVIEGGCHLGFGDDLRSNRRQPKLLTTGISIVGKRAKLPPGIKIGRNCVIYCDVEEGDFPASEVRSGETIEPRQ